MKFLKQKKGMSKLHSLSLNINYCRGGGGGGGLSPAFFLGGGGGSSGGARDDTKIFFNIVFCSGVQTSINLLKCADKNSS